MAHTALTPIFVGLRTGLHGLFITLVGLVVGRALLVPSSNSVAVVVVSLILLVTYAAGGLFVRAARTRGRLPGFLWLTLVSVEWLVLLSLSSLAAYLVFVLFFLYLHILGRGFGTLMVLITTGVAIVALGVEGGWSVGGVIGPLVGAAVAVMIGLGYQALAREAAERERLMSELLATRDRLALIDHESGVLAERARLAREIHDTVAQGLSSIQMLLHAAERADPERPGVEHIRLARETAASNLADTRRFISELTPPNLDEAGLGGTLRRLADTQWVPQGLAVTVRISDALTLPMYLQTALLRIAQGAIANVIQHAQATSATITLAVENDEVRFTIADDGRGFDPSDSSSDQPGRRTDSFGLQATRERVDQLGGVLTVDSAPGRGSVVTVDLTLKDSA
ncbi:sensor histidine kinase [Cryobacterium sp. PAMC25264]|uniref:sensor histidine kinase n=1 Tax=Cryobacterium sp. PAMC25264 TaxID=2861288 RepID=UPI001C63B790|nr:sensor histidine kinase [Cryobacterium sp. PAMC25264]QYF72329.1 sensor histidine kinase [Cryobacterium sp. PAMC25264]